MGQSLGKGVVRSLPAGPAHGHSGRRRAGDGCCRTCSDLLSAIRSGAVAGEPFDEVLVRGCEVALAGMRGLALAGHRGRHPRRGARTDAGSSRRSASLASAWSSPPAVSPLVGALGAPAHADEGSGSSPVDGLPLPDRATTTTLRRPGVRARRRHIRTDRPPRRASGRPSVVVRPGDTLWAIARAELPADADGGAMAARVREIHQAQPCGDRHRPRPDPARPTIADARQTIREEHR